MTQLKNSSDRLSLPWPPKELSPNYRGHWAPQAAAKKKYRFAVRILALQHPLPIPEEGPIFLEVEFYAPDNRPRDQDNMIAAFKAGQDGTVWYYQNLAKIFKDRNAPMASALQSVVDQFPPVKQRMCGTFLLRQGIDAMSDSAKEEFFDDLKKRGLPHVF